MEDATEKNRQQQTVSTAFKYLTYPHSKKHLSSLEDVKRSFDKRFQSKAFKDTSQYEKCSRTHCQSYTNMLIVLKIKPPWLMTWIGTFGETLKCCLSNSLKQCLTMSLDPVVPLSPAEHSSVFQLIVSILLPATLVLC